MQASDAEKLEISREMLTLILSYHQVLPSFLEFLFPFARDHHASDFHFGGFRYQVRFSEGGTALRILERGWSGRDLKVCYNLKSPEYVEGVSSNDWPWYMGQSAVHHVFDIETGYSSWIVVKGGEHLKSRIKSATRDQSYPRFLFHTREQAFTSTLEAHLIFCEWSGQNWRWYINFLDKEIQTSTESAVSSLLENPVSLSQEAGETNIRQRYGKQVNYNTRNAAVANGVTCQEASPAIPTRTHPAPENRYTKFAGFSFSDLQKTHTIEEMVNNASLLLKVNLNVLMELKEAYKSFVNYQGWPANLSSCCRGDLARFDQRITNIQNDMIIQQSRVERVLRLIADRKSLVCGQWSVQEYADKLV